MTDAEKINQSVESIIADLEAASHHAQADRCKLLVSFLRAFDANQFPFIVRQSLLMKADGLAFPGMYALESLARGEVVSAADVRHMTGALTRYGYAVKEAVTQ